MLCALLLGVPVAITAQPSAQYDEAALRVALAAFNRLIEPIRPTAMLVLPARPRGEIAQAVKALGLSHDADARSARCVKDGDCADVPTGLRIVTFSPVVRTGDTAVFVGRNSTAYPTGRS